MQTTVKANNLNLYVETFGDRTRPPVLLVMGLASQCLNWFPYFYEPIVEQGYYVIHFDNRDIGLSEWIDPLEWQSKPYSLEDMAQDTVKLLAALKINKVHIFGVSMGGAIAQRIAISHPNRVLSLTSLLSFADAATLTSNIELPSTATNETPSLEMQLSFWRMFTGSGYPFDEELNYIRNSIMKALKYVKDTILIAFNINEQLLVFLVRDLVNSIKLLHLPL